MANGHQPKRSSGRRPKPPKGGSGVKPAPAAQETPPGAIGFVAKNGDGELLVETIQTTARGAMVNWLVTEAGVQVYRHHSETEIAAAFDAIGVALGCSIVQVEIRERKQ